MVGRSVLLARREGAGQPLARDSARQSSGLTALGDRGETAVDDLSLAVQAGEIVGLAGVQGNGQDELVECIAGLRRPLAGHDRHLRQPRSRTPTRATAATPGSPTSRPTGRGVGLSLMSRVWENMTLGHLEEFSNGPLLAAQAARRRAAS